MKWIYLNNKEDSSRFVLGTEGNNPVVCIGVNPSTASPECLDNTIKSVERIALGNGYDSWIMLNLYPQRATNPRDLHDCIDEHLVCENLLQIARIMEKFNPDIWAAWGTLINERSFLPNCLIEIVELASRYKNKWLYGGALTKNGHPRHPLYLSRNTVLEKFDIEEYLKKLSNS